MCCIVFCCWILLIIDVRVMFLMVVSFGISSFCWKMKLKCFCCSCDWVDLLSVVILIVVFLVGWKMVLFVFGVVIFVSMCRSVVLLEFDVFMIVMDLLWWMVRLMLVSVCVVLKFLMRVCVLIMGMFMILVWLFGLCVLLFCWMIMWI